MFKIQSKINIYCLGLKFKFTSSQEIELGDLRFLTEKEKPKNLLENLGSIQRKTAWLEEGPMAMA